ncbi:MAG: IS66 family transposase [Deltaproteobacteria bacterium]|nr:IS66 family transposase [Deltaproteobacteria bacterium]
MTVYTLQHLEQFTKAQLVAIIIEQTEIIGQLEVRIAALEKNSGNSSKPPSTDLSPHHTHSLRERSGKPSGGQYGHPGVTRTQVANPDRVVLCRPTQCEKCGENLDGETGLIRRKRQEADIPPIAIEVTEYQQEMVSCRRCGHTTTGAFPTSITAPFQIGDNLKATIIYLNVAHHIPFERCTALLDDLLSVRIGEGSVDTALTDGSEHAQTLYRDILESIKQGAWVGGDETGTHVNGEKSWQWVWQNERGSYYAIEPCRGYRVVKEHFGEDYRGTLVSDCWSAQNNTKAGAHQHCHPHYLRDLQFSIETERSAWAYAAFRFLIASERARAAIWADGFDTTLRGKIVARYERELETLIGRPATGNVAQRIQKRMRKHQEKILYFMHDSDTPFHNNSSERAIRNAKLHKKISGGFRSEHGARRHAILLSVIETCKKRKMDILVSLRLLFQGKLSFQGP